MFINNLLKNICFRSSIFGCTKNNQVGYIYFHVEDKKNIQYLNNYLFFFLKEILSDVVVNEKIKLEMLFLQNVSKEIFFFNNNFYFLLKNSFFISNNFSFYGFFFFRKKNFNFFKNFFFLKFLKIELCKKYLISHVNLPKKIKKYTILRSPFIFKKGREQFEKKEFKHLMSYSFLFSNTFFSLINKYHKKKILMKHKYVQLKN